MAFNAPAYGAARLRASRAGKPQVIAHRGLIPRSYRTSTASAVLSESRILARTGPVAAGSIQFGYCNWYDNEAGSTGETDFSNAGTLRSALELLTPSASYCKGRWGGVEAPPLPSGVPLYLSDPMPVVLPPNTNFYVRSSYKVAAVGDPIPTSQRNYSSFDRGYLSDGTSASQVPGFGNMSVQAGGSFSEGFGPSLIIGIPQRPTPAVLIWGDSLISGVGDATYGGDSYGNLGYAARALGNIDAAQNVIPYTFASRAGNRLSLEDYNPSYRKRAFFQYHTHVLTNLGTNDVSAGTSLSTMQAYYLRQWAEFKAAGLHVTQVLLTSKVYATTDSYATAAGQSLSSGYNPGELCDQLNLWIKTQVGTTIDAALDPRPLVQDANNKWVVNGGANYATADGTHYTQPFHAAIASNLILPWAKSLAVGAR